MKTARVLIVEDETLFSDLLHRTLSVEAGLEVVGVVGEGVAAIEAVATLDPDVVLMDIELPGELDGIEAALQIKEATPEIGMVILSAHKDRRYVTSLPLDTSVGWSYLLKQSVPNIETVVRAIEGSREGMVVLDPQIVSGLTPARGSAVAKLSPRGQEVLSLMAQGYTNAAIARTLALAEKSVETYINGIYQGLQISGEHEVHARVTATLMYLEESESRW